MTNINLIQAVARSMEDNRQESYLDRKKMEILKFSEFDDLELSEEFRENLDAFPEQFLLIPVLTTQKDLLLMEYFTDEIASSEVQDQLYPVLKEKNAHSLFQKVLENYPAEKESWLQFKEYKLNKMAKKWLKEQGVLE